MAKKRKTHLIIPDPHAHPSYSNNRFTALGHLIGEVRPDTIVCLGDFANMASLSFHDKGKLAMEGRRYKSDIEVTLDAQLKLMEGFRKVKNYSPQLIITLGNHEGAITRAVQENSALEGKLSLSDLQYEGFGWRVIPFLQPICLDGVWYCHYFVSGLLGKPISGESPARQMCLKLHRSAVAGHSHIFDHAERSSLGGQKVFGLHAGCYVHPDFDEAWCTQSKEMWWRGVVILRDLDGQGYYDHLEAITMRKILREYS